MTVQSLQQNGRNTKEKGSAATESYDSEVIRKMQAIELDMLREVDRILSLIHI